jgi:cysteinyl-tRNA synthetase
LRRTVLVSGFDAQHVMNFTDVDDKTIRRSQTDFPKLGALEALQALTNKYGQLFLEDMQRIGNDIHTVTFLKATDTIEEMKQFITELHQKGFAYIADDGVYFSIEAYRKSGKKYGQLLELSESNTSEARIQNDEYDKESVHDFALWKIKKEGEPSWEFSLDGQNIEGRPGWHIECSVMSRIGLGQPFDIHTGGIDLIFPHHENEVAQSTAGEDNPVMATFFTHNDHILVDGKKMSKSLGNFYTLEDIVLKGCDPLAFRVKVLQSHYRNQINFTWESIEAAKNLLDNLRDWADLKHQTNVVGEYEGALAKSYANGLRGILEAVQNDLNMPEAISILANLASEGEGKGIDSEKIQPLLNILDKLFGLQLGERPGLTEVQKGLIAGREDARESKDWARSDELRDALKVQGIAVRDTPRGTVWSRIPA